MGKDLLPILRSFDRGDLFAQTVVHRRLADDLAVFLAWVAPTARGTRGIDYLLTRTVREKQVDEAELFELAYDELKGGLEVSAAAGDPELDARITMNLLHAPVFYGMTFSACVELEENREVSALKREPGHKFFS